MRGLDSFSRKTNGNYCQYGFRPSRMQSIFAIYAKLVGNIWKQFLGLFRLQFNKKYTLEIYLKINLIVLLKLIWEKRKHRNTQMRMLHHCHEDYST